MAIEKEPERVGRLVSRRSGWPRRARNSRRASQPGRRRLPEPLEELMQVGYVGLIKAINNFDPALATRLRPYAEPCVRGEIKRYFRDRRWQVHVPTGASDLRLELRASREELTPPARAPSRECGSRPLYGPLGGRRRRSLARRESASASCKQPDRMKLCRRARPGMLGFARREPESAQGLGCSEERGCWVPDPKAGSPPPSRDDFEHLLAFRVSLRRFQHWSENQARAAGVTHVQHQLLVAIKGHPGKVPPAIGDIAGYLMLRHHSAVELVDRAEAAGLVLRSPDADDARVVRVRLTRRGDRLVGELSQAHIAELHNLASALNALIQDRSFAVNR
jgi:RNA polymerase sigma factor (sigma-70 family)